MLGVDVWCFSSFFSLESSISFIRISLSSNEFKSNTFLINVMKVCNVTINSSLSIVYYFWFIPTHRKIIREIRRRRKKNCLSSFIGETNSLSPDTNLILPSNWTLFTVNYFYRNHSWISSWPKSNYKLLPDRKLQQRKKKLFVSLTHEHTIGMEKFFFVVIQLEAKAMIVNCDIYHSK